MINVSLLVKDYSLTDLWRLDVLGITDPGEARSKQEIALVIKEGFHQRVCTYKNGRNSLHIYMVVRKITL